MLPYDAAVSSLASSAPPTSHIPFSISSLLARPACADDVQSVRGYGAVAWDGRLHRNRSSPPSRLAPAALQSSAFSASDPVLRPYRSLSRYGCYRPRRYSRQLLGHLADAASRLGGMDPPSEPPALRRAPIVASSSISSIGAPERSWATVAALGPGRNPGEDGRDHSTGPAIPDQDQGSGHRRRVITAGPAGYTTVGTPATDRVPIFGAATCTSATIPQQQPRYQQHQQLPPGLHHPSSTAEDSYHLSTAHNNLGHYDTQTYNSGRRCVEDERDADMEDMDHIFRMIEQNGNSGQTMQVQQTVQTPQKVSSASSGPPDVPDTADVSARTPTRAPPLLSPQPLRPHHSTPQHGSGVLDPTSSPYTPTTEGANETKEAQQQQLLLPSTDGGGNNQYFLLPGDLLDNGDDDDNNDANKDADSGGASQMQMQMQLVRLTTRNRSSGGDGATTDRNDEHGNDYDHDDSDVQTVNDDGCAFSASGCSPELSSQHLSPAHQSVDAGALTHHPGQVAMATQQHLLQQQQQHHHILLPYYYQQDTGQITQLAMPTVLDDWSATGTQLPSLPPLLPLPLPFSNQSNDIAATAAVQAQLAFLHQNQELERAYLEVHSGGSSNTTSESPAGGGHRLLFQPVPAEFFHSPSFHQDVSAVPLSMRVPPHHYASLQQQQQQQQHLSNYHYDQLDRPITPGGGQFPAPVPGTPPATALPPPPFLLPPHVPATEFPAARFYAQADSAAGGGAAAAPQSVRPTTAHTFASFASSPDYGAVDSMRDVVRDVRTMLAPQRDRLAALPVRRAMATTPVSLLAHGGGVVGGLNTVGTPYGGGRVQTATPGMMTTTPTPTARTTPRGGLPDFGPIGSVPPGRTVESQQAQQQTATTRLTTRSPPPAWPLRAATPPIPVRSVARRNDALPVPVGYERSLAVANGGGAASLASVSPSPAPSSTEHHSHGNSHGNGRSLVASWRAFLRSNGLPADIDVAAVDPVLVNRFLGAYEAGEEV